jgi:hypothetical protein
VLAEARSFIGSVTLQVNLDHAAVTVDGQAVGESPFATEIFVDPGPHTLVATIPGCDPVKDRVRADKGSSHYVTLAFIKCGDKPVPKPPKPPKPAKWPVFLPRPITIGGFIATGVGLGLGTSFAVMAKIKGDEADQKFQAIGSATHNNPKACAGSAPSSDCVTLHNLRVSHDTFANAATWTFVAAGVVGAGTLIYTFAIPPAELKLKAGQALVFPIVGPGTAGLVLRSSF